MKMSHYMRRIFASKYAEAYLNYEDEFVKKVSFKYSKEFDREYEYLGSDLGVFCDGVTTTFKLWTPMADEVKLYLYKEGGASLELKPESIPEGYYEEYSLNREEKGVYSLTLNENLHGVYYDYVIITGEAKVRTADPYAYACGCNGTRSMVVNLALTNPVDFDKDMAPEKSSENIIYELHIKDFSEDEACGIKAEYRGKYKAFTIDNSTLNGEGKVPTCVNYLKELGITHVHLLPMYDYGWLDEAGDASCFNWGYDPLNYNVPEGSYATNPYDGVVRIRECKEMIQALHKAGIRVVMDVVYNHTHEAYSWLERTAPGYFARRNEDGTLSNGSACGSDMAVGRRMVDNYIVNSIMYWAKEYHIDGFRFDLMGLLTTELMNRISKMLDKEYGVNEKLLYGEPWRAAYSPMEEGTHAALKENIDKLTDSVAVFSDDTRDLIKGDVFLAKIPGFVNGGIGLEGKVLKAISGWVESEGDFAPLSCNQIVNYVSAHDNYTLWDKLLITLKADMDSDNPDNYLIPYEEVMKANKLAALMYFTFKGHIFMQAGEEMGRTKYGDENSFRSAASVNMLNWKQTVVFSDLLEYYRGLITLRKQLPGLYVKDGNVSAIMDKSVDGENIICFTVNNDIEGHSSEWSKLIVIYNGSDMYKCKALPEGKWEILADANDANCRKKAGGEIVVPMRSGMILGKKE